MTSTARKRTQQAKQGSQKVDDVLSFRVRGRVYRFDPNQVSGSAAAELRRATGLSVQQVFESFNKAPDIDSISAMMFLSRRQSGERGVTFDDVADEINYGDIAGIAFDELEAEDDSPEA